MQNITPDIMDAVRKFSTKFKNAGYVMIALGILAILFPLVFSIAAKAVLGWIFLLTGAVMLYHAFGSKGWQSALWSGVIALMHLALGVYLSFFALTGLIGLTLIVGLAFLLQGIFEGMIAAQHRPRKGWGWLAFNGAASLVMGVLLISGLPSTALWAIGLLLGINFLTSGIAFVALARAAEK
ncbi:HdeD family acid-resistance protein [Yoonia sp. MH D7]